MKNPIIDELTPETFQTWRHHPVTAAYLQFLEDQTASWREGAADLWEAGRLGPNAEELRGRYLALKELAGLSLDDIKAFYRNSEPEEDETET